MDDNFPSLEILGIDRDRYACLRVIQADFVAIHDPTAVRVIRTDRAGLRG